MLSPNYAGLTTKTKAAAVTITRPNNVTAYAAGQVYGAAVDARISLVVPNAPSDELFGGFNSLAIQLIQNNAPTAGALTLNLFLFTAAPTQLADQALFNLIDADIDLTAPQLASVSGPGTAFVFGTTAADPGALNQSAGAAGRRSSSTAVAGPINSGLQPNNFFGPGTTLTAYLVTTAAYTPLAQEVVKVVPTWLYLSRSY